MKFRKPTKEEMKSAAKKIAVGAALIGTGIVIGKVFGDNNEDIDWMPTRRDYRDLYELSHLMMMDMSENERKIRWLTNKMNEVLDSIEEGADIREALDDGKDAGVRAAWEWIRDNKKVNDFIAENYTPEETVEIHKTMREMADYV